MPKVCSSLDEAIHSSGVVRVESGATVQSYIETDLLPSYMQADDERTASSGTATSYKALKTLLGK